VYILRVVSGPAAGSAFELEGETLVGREGNHVNLADPRLSERHAALHPTTKGVVIEDLGSSNGTFVNGTRIGEPTLITGDATILLGSTELALELLPTDGPSAASRVRPDRAATRVSPVATGSTTRLTAAVAEPSATDGAAGAASAQGAAAGSSRKRKLGIAGAAIVIAGAVAAAVVLATGGAESHTLDLRVVATQVEQTGQAGGADSSVLAAGPVFGSPGGNGAAMVRTAVGQGGIIQGTIQYFFDGGSFTVSFTGRAVASANGAYLLVARQKVTGSGGHFAGASGTQKLTGIVRPGTPRTILHATGSIKY
jgi:hypothetical protein